jgi:hypothetical protein
MHHFIPYSEFAIPHLNGFVGPYVPEMHALNFPLLFPLVCTIFLTEKHFKKISILGGLYELGNP